MARNTYTVTVTRKHDPNGSAVTGEIAFDPEDIYEAGVDSALRGLARQLPIAERPQVTAVVGCMTCEAWYMSDGLQCELHGEEAGQRAERALRSFDAQEALQPGTEGWWQVWGARPTHVRQGDILLMQGVDPIYIADTFTAKASPMRVGLVDGQGERFTLGALFGPIIVVRHGTHHTLVTS